jgi:prevent-host-death family protein
VQSRITRPTPAERHPEQAFRKEAEALTEQMKGRHRPLLDDLLDLTACIAYVEELLENRRVSRYLGKNHATTLSQIDQVIATVRKSAAESEDGKMAAWSIARAKNDLDAVVKEAKTNGPQLIRARRFPVVVVVSIRRWNAMLRRHPELEGFFRQKTIQYSTKTIPSSPREQRATRPCSG